MCAMWMTKENMGDLQALFYRIKLCGPTHTINVELLYKQFYSLL